MRQTIILFLINFLSLSCEKNKNDYHYSDAIIVYSGNPDVDGCGFLIKIDTITYKPQNLPKEFQLDKIKVKVDFSLDGKGYYCGDLPYPKKTVVINSIIKY